MIAWDGPGTEILLNPRLPRADAERVHRLIAGAGPLEGHVWLTTSGATGRLKPVALAKRAMLASAAAVNAHLESRVEDVWLDPLPAFHVSGLGIHARAHLSGATVRALDTWTARGFVEEIPACGATLSSLVPAQVTDLVAGRHRAPAPVRAIVVGGGPLAPEIYAAARDLGWPVLPSYGATECCSQIATAELASLDQGGFPPLRLLSHVDARTDADGRLAVRSPALLTGYATDGGLEDPKRNGWWRTDDLGTVGGRTLSVRGRADDVVKVGGELAHVGELEHRLAAVAARLYPGLDAALLDIPDPRLGHVLHLAVAGDADVAERLRAAYDAAVLPFERARAVYCVAAIPRTALGKVAREELRALLRSQR